MTSSYIQLGWPGTSITIKYTFFINKRWNRFSPSNACILELLLLAAWNGDNMYDCHTCAKGRTALFSILNDHIIKKSSLYRVKRCCFLFLCSAIVPVLLTVRTESPKEWKNALLSKQHIHRFKRGVLSRTLGFVKRNVRTKNK